MSGKLLTSDSFRQIVERSSYIWERIPPRFEIVVADLPLSRLERWEQAVARGDAGIFEKRLKYAGLDRNAASQLLAPAKLRIAGDIPWLHVLQNIIEAASYTLEISEGFRDIPFMEILSPFLMIVQQRLHPHREHLTADAVLDLEKSSLRAISRILTRPIVLELNIARMLGKLNGATTQERYQYFLESRLGNSENLLAFFLEYPVMARLVSEFIDAWTASTIDFLNHLTCDLPELVKEHDKVAKITDGLSDPHNGRRTTKKIQFQSGFKIMYKPRNLGLDRAWMNFLSWINEKKPDADLRGFRVINKGDHGWTEFVQAAPCSSETEAARYYRRAGLLLGILYLLGSTDCHYENLIAAGEYPVLVDLETLLGCEAKADITTAEERAWQIRNQSVLGTGLLPQWFAGGKAKRAIDLSGLAASANQDWPIQMGRWTGQNTDAMSLQAQYVTFTPADNRAFLNESELTPNNYVEHLVQGFQEMTRFLIDNTAELLSGSSILREFSEQTERYIGRSTAEYAMILEQSLNPQNLREGADRSIQIELLCRRLLKLDHEESWLLLDEERASLEAMDIPYFTVNSSGTKVNGRYDVLQQSPFSSVIHRLQGLDQQQINLQIGFLRAAFAIKSSARAPSRRELTSVISRDEFIQSAIEIASDLKSRAIRGSDGSVTWLAPEYNFETEQYDLKPLASDLYSGCAGVGLFFAALDSIESNHRDFALAIFKNVREIPKPGMPIGGMVGSASIAYALFRSGQFLGDDSLMEDAKRVAKRITQDEIQSDQRLDLMSGSAGALLVLLALYAECKEEEFLRRAILCADHLLAKRKQTATGHQCWLTTSEKFLSGFSHGAAGIAYALIRLYQNTSQQKYLEAAEEAFDYENTLFLKEENNWLDLRQGKNGTSCMTSWCNGAAGIALSRLIHSPAKRDLLTALNTTMEYGVTGADDLCCGNSGRIDILWTAARASDDPRLLTMAHRFASTIVQSSRSTGSFELAPNMPSEIAIPSFFKGTAGIGYTLLRIASTSPMPSVLTLE